MSSSILQIVQGLQARLETVSGLRAYDLLEGTPVLPAALILPEVDDYHATMGKDAALTELAVVVHVITTGPTRSVMKAVYAWLDPDSATSVRKAVEDGPTLGGVAADAVVKTGRAGFIDENGLTYFGARFDVTVLIS